MAIEIVSYPMNNGDFLQFLLLISILYMFFWWICFLVYHVYHDHHWYHWLMIIDTRYPLVMTNIAIEHGHRNSEFSHGKWWFSIGMLVYERVRDIYCVYIYIYISIRIYVYMVDSDMIIWWYIDMIYDIGNESMIPMAIIMISKEKI